MGKDGEYKYPLAPRPNAKRKSMFYAMNFEFLATSPQRASQTIETNPSLSDEEDALSNTSAEYQEWPVLGFFKLITIRNEAAIVWSSA